LVSQQNLTTVDEGKENLRSFLGLSAPQLVFGSGGGGHRRDEGGGDMQTDRFALALVLVLGAAT